ncbi:hypothetical protein [Vreelandella populi]|uniref:Uncharacterized protein n=1 Tax=Vreelandella populi TaxID=2498858 RepID=A0A3S0YX13_9GAMM|nr:hypothetical protein [Halomonas populi]RUR43363.1 hypothetical protein ELY37_16735 [Halomonas populi]
MAAVKQPTEKLVTMVFLKPHGRYARHDRAGFPADKAKQLEERKIALPSDKAKAIAATKAAGEDKPPKGTEGADKV